MQLTPVLSGASFALAMFTAYGFHAMVADPPDSDVNETLATAAFLFFSLTVNGALAVKFESERIRVLIAIVSGVFLAVGLAALIILAMMVDTPTPISLTMGVLTTLYLVICYGLSKSGQ
jgi:peptidoglycan/LPS O-acetylase OafA/YrhL